MIDLTTSPAPPPGLARRGPGRRLWEAVLEDFEPSPAELLLLEAACRLADEVSQLQRALRGKPVMQPGSKGQSRVNPLYNELRLHRLALARMLAELDIDQAAPISKSQMGRKLALLRHNRGSNNVA